MKKERIVSRGLDANLHAALGQVTGGLSPATLATAFLDWWLHMIGSPEKQAELIRLSLEPSIRDGEKDPRFADPAWEAYPYNIMSHSFLAAQNWWDAATTDMHGVDPKHAKIVNFVTRQWLDMISPANFAATNPVVQKRTQEEGGQNLLRGARYWMEDFNRLLAKKPRTSDRYVVGKDLATTPGDVVMQNDLVELIRYRPTTAKVHPEPILIVPAWIMKFYILDLTAQRSLVAYLRDQGFEVFILSWKNPDETDADLSMKDYIDLGIQAAIRRVKELGHPRLHTAGYCLGGTLLSIVAAALARDGDESLASVSLLAAQVDFSEPGELGLFINESQVAFLEDIMATQGYLKADQMAGAFQLLRSNDLIWSRVIRHYLLGERTPDNPLMAWNADATRMPARMHTEYLRRLFLTNDLAKGRFRVDDNAVALSDIRADIYCVATETDHVSPWTSVYRLALLTDTDVTFVLTNGGHNGGILSEPGHKGRHFRFAHKTEGDTHMTAPEWFDTHAARDGSWWPHWAAWLKDHSSHKVETAALNDTLGAAPGDYVFG
ncbi:PHA/PHB synthase family protein [Sulfitobacter aestuariivivens]|uniref:Alpha/beta fold hydrolase n=1 Tax=Sulfitobacter aestuariivivens TaxID=2766981 RepID=A0A927D5M8_9RHOB|nr:alpha/beta fold hydrolase [Sulfitobacter aestuariivivens]MBD3665419.1 alpha/beta fold hydrolase [Sulfitobacter aestuariivivens]